MFTRCLYSSVAVLMLGSSASAATLDAQSLMQSLNVIVLGDMDLRNTDHVEGTVYVGGNLNSGALTTGSPTYTNISINTDGMANAVVGDVEGAVIVGGAVSGNFQSATKGDVVVGSSFSGTQGGSGSLTQNVGTDVAGGVAVSDMTQTFENLSSSLAGLTTTVGASFDTTQNFKTFTSGTGGDDGIAAINLSYSDAISMFSASEQLRFDLSSSISSLIINVAGDDFASAGYWDGVNNVWNPGTIVGAQVNDNQPKVLFNFFQATELVLGSNWNASLLAPSALLTSSGGGTNGTVVAGDLILGGEIRPYNDSYLFSGTLPASSETISAVPVPAGLPLVLSGLFALFFARRQRRKAA
ncbi:collagen-binding domain-containing protein [Puniceibacterium sp. IMCC21224]|uniref:collagen-binding domain-containing protein n=1 Tax=Puniceibacterium sp. IMCC21224 TaxID=1618204 RepID=UPI00064DCC3A|nr:collagen-binding domain-containing protein [Puniceibacterium sp. IMCC21224]KMK68457.1 choice-of-anchor A domain [Puniceibacterium sp. IMCC21224]